MEKLCGTLPSLYEKQKLPGVGLNMKSSPFNELAEAYDSWFDEEGKLIFATEVRALQSVLASLPESWLEIGVGSGRFAQALGIGTGLDPSGKLLEIAKKRGIETYQGKGEERFFGEEAFGAVFLIVTLCFVDSPLDVLREINRILQRKGKLVLGLVLQESQWGQLYRKKKEQGDRFYKYATIHSYREIVDILNHTGFVIEKIVSTLFQKPGEVKEIETPREYYSSDAGFVVVIAKKDVC